MAVVAYDWIAYHAATHGDTVAAVELATGRSVTYRDFDRRIGRLAAGLRARCGVKPGERVAVLAHNCIDLFEIQFACGRLGAIFVPINWRLTMPELRHIARDAAPKVLIFDPEFAEAAQELGRDCTVPHLIGHGPTDSDYENLVAAHEALAVPAQVTQDDIATIMYTSGTTGHPKGATITHGMRFWQAINLSVPFPMSTDTVCLTVLPLFHVGGLDVFANPTFHFGGKVLVMRTFDPAACLRALTEASLGVNLFIGVPAHYLFMAQQPAFPRAEFNAGLRAAVGAAPISLAELRQWETRGLALQQAYGMTETCGGVMALFPADNTRKAGSSGKPLLHVQLRLVTPDGREAAVGEIGEIWMKGPSVTPGYWKSPAANAATFTDGWLHSGDAATRDAEGYITIVDRWKDMYISGGENVYPAEVEEVLYQIPGIAELAVIGVPDERWGEVGRVIAVLKTGAAVTEADIIHHCDGRLARYKQPRSVRFVDALPRNATGKVHKPTLRGMFGGSAIQ